MTAQHCDDSDEDGSGRPLWGWSVGVSLPRSARPAAERLKGSPTRVTKSTSGWRMPSVIVFRLFNSPASLAVAASSTPERGWRGCRHVSSRRRTRKSNRDALDANLSQPYPLHSYAIIKDDRLELPSADRPQFTGGGGGAIERSGLRSVSGSDVEEADMRWKERGEERLSLEASEQVDARRAGGLKLGYLHERDVSKEGNERGRRELQSSYWEGKSTARGVPRRVRKKERSGAVRELLQALDELPDVKPADAVLSTWSGRLSMREASTVMSEQRQCKRVDEVYRWMKDSEGWDADVCVYNILIKAYSREGMWKRVEEVVGQMQQENKKPDNRTFATIIDACCQQHRHGEAATWYKRMEEGGCHPDEVTVRTMMRLHGKEGNVEGAEALFFDFFGSRGDRGEGRGIPRGKEEEERAMGFAGPERSGSRASSRENEGIVRRSSCSSCSSSPSARTCNVMIDVYARAGNFKEAERLYRMMMSTDEEDGRITAKPDRETYNTMMKVYGDDRNLPAAERVFTRLLDDPGCSPDQVSYNTMISLYGKCGRIRFAEKVYLMMEQDPASNPDELTYNTMIHMYAREGRVEKAEGLLTRMLAAGFTPDTRVHNAMIGLYGRAGRYEDAGRVFREMRLMGGGGRRRSSKESPVVDRAYSTYHVLMSVYARAGMFDEAMAVWKEMRGEGEEEPNRVACHIMTDVCGRAGWVEEGVGVVEEMVDRGMVTVEEACCMAVDMCEKAGKADEAVSIFRRLIARADLNRLVGDLAWVRLIEAHGRAGRWEAAVRVIEVMKSEGCAPGVAAYTAAMDACAEALRVEEAEALLSRMQGVHVVDGQGEELGEGSEKQLETVRIDVPACNALMKAYERAGQVSEARLLFDEMQTAGLPPSLATFTTMVCMYKRAGLFKEAEDVREQMLEQGFADDRVSCNCLLDLYGKSGRVEEAEELVRSMMTPPREDRTSGGDAVEDGSDGAGSAGISSDGQSGGAGSRGIGIDRDSNGAGSLGIGIDDGGGSGGARSGGIGIDVVTCNTMMNMYGKAGSVVDVRRWWRKLRELDLQPDLVSFCTIVDACGRAELHKEALAGVREMRRRFGKFGMNVVAYNLAIRALGRAGEVEEALNLFLEMKKAGVRPDVVTYSTVIAVYGTAKMLDGAVRTFRGMRAAGCEPNAVTYNAIIDAYKIAGRLEDADWAFIQMGRSPSLTSESCGGR
ncbi:hypothetical protein CBR_g22948 [Chara braunii]|uniref:Pentacotripeptide-repeat region of PRORP domain-containing protein n=1 Tax=Chara braunii TaxID=69332 RepID=A0A388L349_CHABU|nr:hypothetical protein CBR_g22948 [Chara braunii]|eukprot:GBG76730.1 hypothetical protein CBR_g22948 [Chara braunii]